ncbi:DUF6382 domain-containing protein [Butyrivibrio sp. LC3010]|uniref:DUF6382 domain-containing protein n=1 Tax=Butyrivibrio sp. LC3010 TaxID=1280680 RepID=UPI00047EFAE9|nr:DUF6382 domain-containing protein [Butyrivibrio sp. LC3010]
MEIEYYKDAKHNYLILKADVNDENMFQYRMLENNSIEGLLPFSLRNMDGCFDLYYEMDSKQSIKNKYINRKMSYDRLAELFKAYVLAAKNLEDYLLDSSHIVLSPETIFEDFSSGSFSFVYDPGYENILDSGFLEELLEFADLEDDKAQGLIYKLLDSICDNGMDFNYLWSLVSDVSDLTTSTGSIDEKNFVNNYEDWDLESTDDSEPDPDDAENATEKKIGIKLPFEGSFFMAILFAIVAGVLVYLRYAFILTYEENLLDIAVFMVSVLMSLSCLILQLRKNDNFFKYRNSEKDKVAKSDKDNKKNKEIEKKKDDEFSDNKNSKRYFDGNIGNHRETVIYKDEEVYAPGGTVRKSGDDFSDEEGFEETVLLSLDFQKQGHKLYAIDDTELDNINLGKLPLVVGKLAKCSDAVIKDKTVSRMHARIFKSENGNNSIWIQDLNSTNGTYINGRRLMPNEKAELNIDDEVSFGKCAFAYR